MNSLSKIALLSGICALGLCATPTGAQQKKPMKKPGAPMAKKAPAGPAVLMADGFYKLPSGLQYKIMSHGTGTKKPIVGDFIEMNIHVVIGDSVIFDSRKMFDNKPVPFQITPPKYKGDASEGFMLLVAGDSAIFRLPVDSLDKRSVLPWMKNGQLLEQDVKMVTVQTAEEHQKDMAIKMAMQKAEDDRLLQEYFKSHNLKPMKTASGMYYVITQEGMGEKASVGQTASVFYTGKFMDGKPFDSNMDSSFHHTEAFKVEVGKGHVIKGWDEGLQLMKKGTRATLYIPSELAYGPNERSPIPANSILVFDLEIKDLNAPVPQIMGDDNTLQAYFKEHNLHPKKTASGLYYTITKPGTGEKAKPGEKIGMSYLGKTLDGKKFDGNVDDNFNNTRPFSFTLGVGQVIKGWDEGIALLNKGAKATLYLPSDLAYGPQSPTPAIPPNSALVFDVEVLSIDKK